MLTTVAHAQVDEIKKASSSLRSTEVTPGSSSGTGNFVIDIFVQLMLGEVINVQQQRLQRRHEIPSTVSVELLLQGAAQPSSYYVLNPRLRANWGLFSTDFRFNYLLEEDIDGIKYLRSNEWQILQINLITTKDVNFRVGGGVIQEAYGARNNFEEFTMALHLRPATGKFGGLAEYRHASMRREANAHVRYTFIEKQHVQACLTAGVVYQRYYSSISVWGFQGGVAFSVF
jgi:hypothetical protein